MPDTANEDQISARRLAIVLSHPVQYYAPWFRRLARERLLTTRVFYLSGHGATPSRDPQFGQAFAWDTDLLSGYDHTFVPNLAKNPGVDRFWGLHNPTLLPVLDAFSPEAILLYGYAYRPHLHLILRRPAPLIFRGDSHLLGAPLPTGLKRVLLRFIYSRCAAFLPVGKANAAYFRHYGVPTGKLHVAPHCVDADHFKATPGHLAEAARLRRSLGIPTEAMVLLFAGKLIHKKRPDLLLAAFLRSASTNTHLVISGDGEMLPTLRAVAGTQANIHFLPFANQSAMPARYLLGDIFVLPSEGRHETWGLAVNEAMHLGRPVILSDQVGCQQDLLAPGKTGWLFPAGNETALAAALHDALTQPREALAAMGQAAAERIAAFNYDSATAGLIAALRSIRS